MKAPYEVGGSLFLNYFFPFFWEGRVLSKIRKKCDFGESQKRPGRWNGVNDFQNLANRQFFVATIFLISEHCVESWKFCSRSFRALVLLNCPNSKLYEEAVGYCGKNAKVDIIWLETCYFHLKMGAYSIQFFFCFFRRIFFEYM